MNKITYILDSIGVCGTTICISLEGFENVISIIVGVLTVISLAVSLTFKVINQVKKAKADGKVTSEEIEEIGKTITDGINDIKDEIKKGDN